MPPKRKRTGSDTQPATSTSISTRSTTRGAATETNSTRNSTASKSRPKASTKSTATDTPRRKSQNSTVRKKLDNPVELAFEPEELEPPHKKGNKNLTVPAASSRKRASTAKWSPYSRLSMENLFAKFADEENSSIMGAEALERLYREAKISMDGAQPLLLAWLLEASDLGRLKKDEWFRGLGALQIDTLEKLSFALSEYEALLISDIPCPKPQPTKKHERGPYNRELNYWTYAADTSKAFLKFYMFLFLLAKAPQERNLDVEIARAFWIALLSEKYPIANDLVEFINDKGNVRGVNKDLWGMTLEFCKTFNASLDGFELDGAWPTLLDDFYTWKTAKQLPANVVRDEIDV